MVPGTTTVTELCCFLGGLFFYLYSLFLMGYADVYDSFRRLQNLETLLLLLMHNLLLLVFLYK